jgi:hypothetical protein
MLAGSVFAGGEVGFAEVVAVLPLVVWLCLEGVEDPLMRKIRTLDKLVDELAKGRAMEKILRA